MTCIYKMVEVDDIENLDIESIYLEIVYRVVPGELRTYHYPGCSASVEIEEITVLEVLLEGGETILPSEEQELIILKRLDSDVLETLCWEDYDNID